MILSTTDGVPGRTIAPDAIYISRDDQRATGVLDGIVFRVQRQDLVRVRPCAWCGIGQFESPTITSLVELGYVLSRWQPVHPDCQADDPVD